MTVTVVTPAHTMRMRPRSGQRLMIRPTAMLPMICVRPTSAAITPVTQTRS